MPFGPYKDFKDCIRQNSDKRSPEAYCATIEHRIRVGACPQCGKRTVSMTVHGR